MYLESKYSVRCGEKQTYPDRSWHTATASTKIKENWLRTVYLLSNSLIILSSEMGFFLFSSSLLPSSLIPDIFCLCFLSFVQQGKDSFLEILHKYMEVHGTVYYETQRPPEVPAFVKNHGLLPQHELQQLLRKAKASDWSGCDVYKWFN